MLKFWIVAVTSSALLGLASFAADAAPLGNAGVVRGDVAAMSAIEKVASRRRCWWRNGVRHCRHPRVVRPSRYDFEAPYGRARPEDLPTGSTAWWRAMDEEGRGGHGLTP